MVNKIVYQNGETLEIVSVDIRKPINTFLTKFPGSVAIDTDNFPPDNGYFEAWELSGSDIVVNMTKAKEIHKTKLRNKRRSLFKRLDEIQIEAASRKKDKTVIDARKQYLRDIPDDPAIESATTIEELNAVSIVDWEEPDLDTLETDTSEIPIMFYANSESESSTTSRTYVQKTRLSFNSKETSYLIWYYSEIYTSKKNKKISTRVVIDGTETIHESDTIPAVSNELGWGIISGQYIASFSEGAHTIDFDYSSNGGSVSVRRTRIIVSEVKLGN